MFNSIILKLGTEVTMKLAFDSSCTLRQKQQYLKKEKALHNFKFGRTKIGGHGLPLCYIIVSLPA